MNLIKKLQRLSTSELDIIEDLFNSITHGAVCNIYRDLMHNRSECMQGADGKSLLSLLASESLDTKAIAELFTAIASKLAESDTSRPLTARELAAKHDLEPLSLRDSRRNLQNTLLGSGHGS